MNISDIDFYDLEIPVYSRLNVENTNRKTLREEKEAKLEVLIDKFNLDCSKIDNNLVNYQDWKKMYNDFITLVEENISGFDYVAAGNKLLNCVVYLKNSAEQVIYKQEKTVIAACLTSLEKKETANQLKIQK